MDPGPGFPRASGFARRGRVRWDTARLPAPEHPTHHRGELSVDMADVGCIQACLESAIAIPVPSLALHLRVGSWHGGFR